MSRTRTILLTALRAGIGIALLVYLGTSGAINWKSLAGLAKTWRLTLLSLALLFVCFYIVAVRLAILMAPLGMKLSYGASMKLALIGQFFSTFLPGGTSGDVMKIYYASQGKKGKRTELATIVLLDRAIGMFSMLLFSLLLAPFFPDLLQSSAGLRRILWFAALLVGGMLFGFCLCLSTRVRNSRLLVWIFRNFPLGSYAERMFDTLHGFSHHPGPLAVSVLLSLGGNLLTAWACILLAAATGGVMPPLSTILLVPIGFLANTIPLTPGGLGIGEAAFGKLFRMVHIRTGAEALLGWRLLSTLISLLGLVYYLQGRKQFIEETRNVAEAEPLKSEA